jgi:hypothetical protein
MRGLKVLIEFLVEEPSMEAALGNLLPRALGQTDHFRVHVFQGKTDLLKELPARLAAYRRWLPPDGRIVVLVDRDADDCSLLKARLDELAKAAGLRTRSEGAGSCSFQVLNRIAVEELEAWFFGDPEALFRAYPRLPQNLGRRPTYRDPDAIRGGTWEALHRVLRQAGYYPGGMPKIQVARCVSACMEPSRNRSHSFQVFWRALVDMVSC